MSINSDGVTQGVPGSFNPQISGNGRFVAFVSQADVLVDGDNNSRQDIPVTTEISLTPSVRPPGSVSPVTAHRHPTAATSRRSVTMVALSPLVRFHRWLATTRTSSGIFMYATEILMGTEYMMGWERPSGSVLTVTVSLKVMQGVTVRRSAVMVIILPSSLWQPRL